MTEDMIHKNSGLGTVFQGISPLSNLHKTHSGNIATAIYIIVIPESRAKKEVMLTFMMIWTKTKPIQDNPQC